MRPEEFDLAVKAAHSRRFEAIVSRIEVYPVDTRWLEPMDYSAIPIETHVPLILFNARGAIMKGWFSVPLIATPCAPHVDYKTGREYLVQALVTHDALWQVFTGDALKLAFDVAIFVLSEVRTVMLEEDRIPTREEVSEFVSVAQRSAALDYGQETCDTYARNVERFYDMLQAGKSYILFTADVPVYIMWWLERHFDEVRRYAIEVEPGSLDNVIRHLKRHERRIKMKIYEAWERALGQF